MPRRQREKPYVPREITDDDFAPAGHEHDPEAQDAEPHPPEWTKGELIDAAGISPKSFDTIRKATRIKGPSHGGLKHKFSAMDVIAMVQRAESGTFSQSGKPVAEAWRKLLEEAGMKMPVVIPKLKRGG